MYQGQRQSTNHEVPWPPYTQWNHSHIRFYSPHTLSMDRPRPPSKGPWGLGSITTLTGGGRRGGGSHFKAVPGSRLTSPGAYCNSVPTLRYNANTIVNRRLANIFTDCCSHNVNTMSGSHLCRLLFKQC